MEECIEIYHNLGHLHAAYIVADKLAEEYPEWEENVYEWAKILWGDEGAMHFI